MMKFKLFFVLFIVLSVVLSACGNDEVKEKENEKPKSSKEEKKKEDKSSKKKSDSSNEKPKETAANTNESQVNQNDYNQQPVQTADENTVIEHYNGQTHTTYNNPVQDNYVEGVTDPIYEREYKHYYTPEEAQRAQQNSDAILREMGLEPTRYE